MFRKHILSFVSALFVTIWINLLGSDCTCAEVIDRKIGERIQICRKNYQQFALPRLNAAQTPDCARAKTISRAATISIIFDLFLRKGSTMAQCPLGSWVSYSS